MEKLLNVIQTVALLSICLILFGIWTAVKPPVSDPAAELRGSLCSMGHYDRC